MTLLAAFLSTWPFLATGGFAAFLGIATRLQPRRPGTGFFRAVVSFWLVWALAAAGEQLAPSLAVRFLFIQVQAVCALMIAPLDLFFVLEYTGLVQPLSFRQRLLILLPALLFILLNLTNPLHHLIWIEPASGTNIIQARGLLSTLEIVTSYSYWIASLGVLVGSMLRSPGFLWPLALMAVGQSFPRLAYMAAHNELSTLSPLQITVLTTVVTGLAYYLALFITGMLRVAPVGREAAIQHMGYGLIVLDAEQRVADLNPAARGLPGMPPGLSLGRPADHVLGDWWARLAPLIGPAPAEREVQVGQGPLSQVYHIYSLPLTQANGFQTGQVFLLNDITQVCRDRQQLAQQQWAQATQQERELLAHELHDGLAQNLAFLNVQAQAAQTYLQLGQGEAAQSCMARLGEVALQMQGDTRELIGNLLSVTLPAEGLAATLLEILTNFQQQTGLPAHLSMEPELEELIEPAVAVQLVRIVQEALANVRKHAGRPQHTRVRLAVEGQQLSLVIEDDGAGFDPGLPRSSEHGHFGLQVMRQRSQRIGGDLFIDAAPGKGTRLHVCVPLGGARSTG